jgi:hypothetical protein
MGRENQNLHRWTEAPVPSESHREVLTAADAESLLLQEKVSIAVGV